ncbi:MAG: DNA translocase FtsK [Clostridia bacterium]|nr:DNA translocase FtsK [Clostridia bacterium]
MAAKKGSGTKKGNTKSVPQKTNKKPVIALILFAVSLLILAVVFIPGENGWLALKTFFFGLFGALTYVFPFYLIAVSVFYAMDKLKGLTLARFIETAVLIVLIQGCVDIFTTNPETMGTFTEHITAVYQSGITLKSGGFFGGIIGWPLLTFGKGGAIATIFLLMFVFVMLITGTTVVTLVRKMQSSAKTVKQSYKEFRDTVEEQRAARREEIDIPLDEPNTQAITAGMNDKQRKVISTYRDIDIPVSDDDTAEESEGVTVEEALDAAFEETKPAKRTRKMANTEDSEETEVQDQTDIDTIEMKEETYQYPPLDLLKLALSKSPAAERAELENTAQRLVDTLRSFGVETSIVDISRGPTVTRYELQPSSGVKISKITNLADDIALNLATAGVRIEAPIPNKAAVGIEVPNKASNVVHIREILESSAFTGSKSKLTIALGKDIAGNAIVGDISKMPHGLIAGATGSGKSVCINSIVVSILYKATPDEVKLIMVDPKVVELGVYNGIPHLLLPVVTDPRKAASTLGWAVSEMEKRYQMFAASGVRDIDGYNRVAEADEEMVKLPRIVIIVDELADLMMTAPKEVEDSINRIAAKARAAGMHLIIATQRPSVDVVTGVIKANIPSRIAFAVSSQIDSRTILDNAGAEKLLGRGDMLFSPVGSTKPSRIQGCFVSDEEVEKVTDFVKGRHTTEYDESIMEDIENRVLASNKDKAGAATMSDDDGDEDPMLQAAIEFVVESGQASTSMLQRKLKLGYARAARIMDNMADIGIIGPYNGAKPREVLMTKEQLLEKKARED